MRHLLGLGLVALVACGASDARLVATGPSPVVAGERDPLPVKSTTTAPTTTTTTPPRSVTTKASRGGERSPGPRAEAPPSAHANPGGSQTALASWYDRGCCTASGERFDPNDLTFAARSRQWGRRIRFCHDGRCVVARQNDYGPAAWTGRTFDLSRAAFEAIGRLKDGEITVTWEVL